MSDSNTNINQPTPSQMVDRSSSGHRGLHPSPPSPSHCEPDRLLPIANVGRIMKQILPSNAKISKEAKETMQECASEFIGFVTGEASDKCRKERRKTVNGDDVCWAVEALGFDNYAAPLKRYLNRYREVEGDRANQINKIGNNSEAHEVMDSFLLCNNNSSDKQVKE